MVSIWVFYLSRYRNKRCLMYPFNDLDQFIYSYVLGFLYSFTSHSSFTYIRNPFFLRLRIYAPFFVNFCHIELNKKAIKTVPFITSARPHWNTYWCELVMKSVFHQLKKIPSTFFISSDVQYQDKRMPFGSVNSVLCYQRLIYKALDSLTDKICFKDILIANT